MTGAYRFSKFWAERNVGDFVVLDQLTLHNASVFVAYACYRLGITPNQLSWSSGVFSFFAFVCAVLLPPDRLFLAVGLIYLFSQLSYLLDCADGQLARSSDTETKFGAFLDKGVDIFGFILHFGAFFAFLYRHHAAQGNQDVANLALAVGFVFLLARTSRFLTWQNFVHIYDDQHRESQGKDGFGVLVMKSGMEHQFSLFLMPFFLLSPGASFVLFGIQSVIFFGAYFRYFLRVYDIENGR